MLLIGTTNDALANGVDASFEQVSLTTLVALPGKYRLVSHEDVWEFRDRHVPESTGSHGEEL